MAAVRRRVPGPIGGANGYNSGVQAQPGNAARWERTPWRHWRRWFGYGWRKRGVWVGDQWIIEYQSERKRARQALEEAYAPALGEASQYASRQYGSTPGGLT